MELRDVAETTAKKFVDDKAITTLCEMDLTKPSEWSKRLRTKETPSASSQRITLSQLEAALEAKWKSPPPIKVVSTNCLVDSAQRLHELLTSEITSSMNIIKNETLYNISLESPLLRDADLLSSQQSIAETWRGTSGF